MYRHFAIPHFPLQRSHDRKGRKITMIMKQKYRVFGILWEISASYMIVAGDLLISQFYVKGHLKMTEGSGQTFFKIPPKNRAIWPKRGHARLFQRDCPLSNKLFYPSADIWAGWLWLSRRRAEGIYGVADRVTKKQCLFLSSGGRPGRFRRWRVGFIPIWITCW